MGPDSTVADVDPAALLADLDADQRRAVTAGSTLVAVIAGAGSGKTRVLTRRVAYRIATETADARHTLVLTFTREAAGELRRRLQHLGVNDQITAGTFHSVANQLLRQRWADLDQAPRTVVDDRSRIIASLPEFSSSAARGDLGSIVDAVSFATARGMSPNAYVSAVRNGDIRSLHEPELVAGVLRAYDAAKRARRIIDLDDLLSFTIDALEHDEAFAEALRWRFRHILVDEAQDLNPLQHRIVDLLRAGRDDVFLVGDPAQAIYGFTGSDPSLLVDVADRFPGVEVIRLPVNHRCTPQVVELGRTILADAGADTTIESARVDGPAVAITSHDDEGAEATAVAASIAEADPTLVRSGQVAVLARTHAALAPVRAALSAAGVALKRRADGPGSELTPLLDEAYRIRDTEQLRRWIRDQHDMAESDDDPRRAVALAANEFLRTAPTGDGMALRAWVSSSDPFGTAEPGVELLTFHGAKGREWHVVHLVGCETSLVPHRSATTSAARAEEARLFYVAATRATDLLTVHWAARRGGYQRKPTPLLSGFEPEEILLLPPPAELVGHGPPERDLVLDRLRTWRFEAARASGILPDALCSDHALARIADQRPASPDELDALTGLGAITSRRLFEGIARALSDARARVS
jgi:DNA helicase-2/ATP-dependent DNA helicase PcrA